MTATPMSVILGLPRMKFAGLVSPEYDIASFDFDNGVTERHYPYIARDGHDETGRKSHSGSFKLYFLNSLELKSFPEKWDEWKSVLLDGSAWPMIHPLLGALDVRVLSGSVTLEAKTTAGIIVEFKWAETMSDPTKDAIDDVTSVSVSALAAAASSAASTIEIPWPNEEAVTDVFDVISWVESSAYSMELTASGIVNQALGKINSAIDFVESLKDHTLAPQKDAFVALYLGIVDAAESAGANKSRATATKTAASDTTLDTLARDTGNSMSDIMTLNPELMGSPIVKAGSVYRYYI